MLLISASMVPITPFQPLCEGGCHHLSEWCIPYRVSDGFTIRRGLRRLIVNDINLSTSACHSQFRLQLREEAAMPQQIGGGCFSRGYDSSTCDGVENGGVVAKKLPSLFHTLSKIHTVHLKKCFFTQ